MKRSTTLFLLLPLVCFALASPATGDAIGAFKQAWLEAQDDFVAQKEALKILGNESSDQALELLLNIAGTDQVHFQVSDAAELHLVMASEGVAWMGRALKKERDPTKRVILARVLGNHPVPAAQEALVKALGDRQWQVQVQAVQSLSRFQDKAVVDALVDLAQQAEREGGRVYSDVLLALERMTGQKLRDGTAWASWWGTRRDAFDFASVGADRDTEGTILRDGQLYEEIHSKRVIFIVDVSGSMRVTAGGGDFQMRSRLEHMKLELARVLESEVQADARFNIIAFSDEVVPMARKLVKATNSTREKAITFVKTLQAEGGTNSYGSLAAAFQDSEVDTIYFLSDGTPTSGEKIGHDEILGEIRKLNRSRSIQIHTIAFLAGDGEALGVIEDKPSAKSFMERLANLGGGRYRLVE